ncbi:MAG: hypothetical protein F6J95_010850 [Leptolyngbya sp. SIO1E4]|nr:hypothetical protein [Leptolyngbya sp. SIO1E4]
MTSQNAAFAIEVVDGYRLGRLRVPLPQVADWLNFLVTPHYQADIISAEQERNRLSIYFEASEGLYSYLESRLTAPSERAA